MRIIIEGNMASGKTLFAQALAKMMGVPLISMDQCRTNVWYTAQMNPHQREKEAQAMAAQMVESHADFVMERIGTGVFDAAMDLLMGDVDLRVLIHTFPAICMRRFENRGGRKDGAILPSYMNDPEGFIYQTDTKLAVRKALGKYGVVINNSAPLDVVEFKGELRKLWVKVEAAKVRELGIEGN